MLPAASPMFNNSSEGELIPRKGDGCDSAILAEVGAALSPSETCPATCLHLLTYSIADSTYTHTHTCTCARRHVHAHRGTHNIHTQHAQHLPKKSLFFLLCHFSSFFHFSLYVFLLPSLCLPLSLSRSLSLSPSLPHTNNEIVLC